MNHLRIKPSSPILIFAFCVALLGFFQNSFAQQAGEKKEFINAVISFYNLENLFDTINTPGVNDFEFTPEGPNRWNAAKYFHKLENMASAIEKIGQELNPDGPAVLGVSEIENRQVLVDLADRESIRDRNYQVVHYDGPDLRGVDVAFLYQPKYFKYISSKPYRTLVPGRDDFLTRYQLLMTGELLGERIHFIVAHWPSRSGGEKASRPLRIAAANTARGIIDSIQAAEPGARIMMMGDLNDDPTDRSVRRHLNANGNINKLKDDQLFNPFFDLFRRGIGSLAYRDSWNLFDQILLTPSLVGNDYSRFQYFRAEVFNPPFLRQPSGRFQGYPFRTFGSGVFLGGYSDHFPTIIYLIREKK